MKNYFKFFFCIEYFQCRSNGRFTDQYNCVKGKYFECVHYEERMFFCFISVFCFMYDLDIESNSNGLLLSRDCPASLRFNILADRCDYSENVQCVYP
jgi:hypothetical protein